MKVMRISYCLFTYLFSLDYLVLKLELQLFFVKFYAETILFAK